MENTRTLTWERKVVPLPNFDAIRRVKKVETIQEKPTDPSEEILIECQECPYCHFTKLKREGDRIVCPICGYGRKTCA
jgi:hypothetical protein